MKTQIANINQVSHFIATIWNNSTTLNRRRGVELKFVLCPAFKLRTVSLNIDLLLHMPEEQGTIFPTNVHCWVTIPLLESLSTIETYYIGEHEAEFKSVLWREAGFKTVRTVTVSRRPLWPSV